MRMFFVSGSTTGSISIFGSEYQISEDKTVSTKDLNSYTAKLSLVTTSLPAGTYRIGYNYSWNLDSTSHSFLGRVIINNTIVRMLHEEEPTDRNGEFESTGSSEKHIISGYFLENLSGINTINLEWGHTGPNGIESSMWDARLEVWRVL